MEARAGPPILAALVARSPKLGADRAVCNGRGGNTSSARHPGLVQQSHESLCLLNPANDDVEVERHLAE